MSSAVFEIFLEYIYSGKSNLITSENLGDLFEASKILRIGTLEAECSEGLPFLLTASNWCRIKAIAGKYHSKEVYEKCQTYALQHFTEIAETDAFVDLPINQVSELVSDGQLMILSEENKYCAVLKWVKHDLKNRKQHLFKLMIHVKFPLMDKIFFIKTVMRESLLIKDLNCSNLLLDVNEFHAGIQPDAASASTASREYLKKALVTYIFATGGSSDGSSDLSECEVYNPRTKKWHPIASMGDKRREHAVIGFGHLLYAFGGCKNQTVVSTVEYYDPMKDTWTRTASMLHERRTHCLFALNESIFICGGYNKDYYCLNTIEQYNPSTGLHNRCAPMNTKRAAFKMAATGGCIYAIGGENSHYLNLVERFDTREGTWYAAPSMSRKRAYLGMTVLNGYIYCTGGLGEGDMADGERFNIRRNAWEPIPNMVSGRWGHEMVALGGSIYAIGKYDMNSAEKFEPDTNRWVAIPSMLHRRFYFGASALDCVKINYQSHHC